MADEEICDYVDCQHEAVWRVICEFGTVALCGGHYAELAAGFREACVIQPIH